MRRVTMASCACLLLVDPSAAIAQRAYTAASAAQLKRWVAAVREHTPGEADAAAQYAATLRYSDRLQLNPAMQLFLRAMRGEGIVTHTDPQHQIMDLFRSVRTDPGLAPFVRHAAILHTDAAIFAERFPPPPDDAPAPGRIATTIDPRTGIPATRPAHRDDELPALLSNERFMLHTDGRVVGETAANWNWPFARSLLDLLRYDRASHSEFPPDSDFVAEWYHAVSAYMLAVGDHGDLRMHLHHAEALADDPRILFDRACFAETMGLSYNQALRDDPGFWDAKTRMNIDMPSQEKTDSEAEELFRRAIAMDAGYAEARVRLARLLERRARYDEAMVELAQAQASRPTRIVAYYGHLVAGRVAQTQGRFADSFDHYEEAAKLYPDAQSALVGASQAAVMTSDVSRALSFVQKLGPRSQQFEGDPWRIYHIGAGRDVNDLMAALWSHVRKQ